MVGFFVLRPRRPHCRCLPVNVALNDLPVILFLRRAEASPYSLASDQLLCCNKHSEGWGCSLGGQQRTPKSETQRQKYHGAAARPSLADDKRCAIAGSIGVLDGVESERWGKSLSMFTAIGPCAETRCFRIRGARTARASSTSCSPDANAARFTT